MRFKNLGIFVLLLVIIVLTTSLNGLFADPGNIRVLIRDTSLYGLISIGVAFVIITGGIDLSIGSLIALSGVIFITVGDIRKFEVDYQSTIAAAVTMADAADEGAGETVGGTGDAVGGTGVAAGGGEFTAVRLSDSLPAVQAGDQLKTDAGVWVAVGIERREGQRWLRLSGVADAPPETGQAAALLRGGQPVRHIVTVHRNPWLCVAAVLGFSALIGLLHGLLIAWGRLQPFVVTLCGLLIYRGMARILSGDTGKGFGDSMVGFKQFVGGAAFQFPLPLVGRIASTSEAWITWIDFPWTGVLLALVTVLAWIFLYKTVYGRHLLALGQNEQAALYSGIATRRLTVFAYVVCSTLAGLAGILFLVDWTTMAPSTAGNFYELYAIAAAVLGGCSLRGGQGALLGVIAGAAVMRCLYKSIDLLGIGKEWEFVVIGTALFAGVVFDEAVRRWSARKQLAAKANAS